MVQPSAPVAAPAEAAAPSAQPAPAPGADLSIPDDVRQNFPDLIALIEKSESMNTEERQYWVNILPIMTPEQQQSLRDILSNERDQLAAIDAKYSSEIEKIGEEQFLQKTADERRKRTEQRSQEESAAQTAENQAAEDMLNQINAA